MLLLTLVISCALCTVLLLLRAIRLAINRRKLELVRSYQAILQEQKNPILFKSGTSDYSISEVSHFFAEQANYQLFHAPPEQIMDSSNSTTTLTRALSADICLN